MWKSKPIELNFKSRWNLKAIQFPWAIRFNRIHNRPVQFTAPSARGELYPRMILESETSLKGFCRNRIPEELSHKTKNGWNGQCGRASKSERKKTVPLNCRNINVGRRVFAYHQSGNGCAYKIPYYYHMLQWLRSFNKIMLILFIFNSLLYFDFFKSYI